MSKYLLRLTALILTCLLLSIALCSNDIAESATVSLGGSIISDACESDVCHGFAGVMIEAYDESGKKIFSGKSNPKEFGHYYIEGLFPGSEYKIVINDPKYLKRIYFVKLPDTDKYSEFSRDFLVVPKKKELDLLLHVPPFELRKSKIRVGSSHYLDDIEAIIKENPEVHFEIRCFPDNDEDEEKNIILTISRCNTLKEYFASRGIDPKRITIHANPYTDPKLPPPANKNAKGKRYVGSTYLVVVDY